MDKDDTFTLNVASEIERARQMFPDSRCSFAALIEEVGELAEALVFGDYDAIQKEAQQVAVMAQRVAVDGDVSIQKMQIPGNPVSTSSRLTIVMVALGELARTMLKEAAGKKYEITAAHRVEDLIDATNQLRIKGDPTIAVTDPTVIASM